jgi:hypothetical protein
LKYNVSENINERNAAINNNLSVVEKFFSMVLLIFNVVWAGWNYNSNHY